MRILISIDDTDSIESRGTGELAAILAEEIEKNQWGRSSYITRHQLLVHPDVPYTSHNSSMCFSAEVDDRHLDAIISHASGFLEEESAVGSDPGLCIAPYGDAPSKELVEFGEKAKREIVTQRQAYEVALHLGIHLSAHGGTGDGVIGALAGVGLRMSGNDGRLRGSLKVGPVNGVALVGDLYTHPWVDEVRSLDGNILPDEERVILGEKVKTVLLDGKSVLLVMPVPGIPDAAPAAKWRTCPKQLLKNY